MISSSSAFGADARLLQMLRDHVATFGSLNWSGDRLTATRTWSGHCAASSSAVRSTHSPILRDQPGFFGQRDELGGRDRARASGASSAPAPRTRKFPRRRCGRSADNATAELAALDRLAQVVLEHLALGRFAVHRRLVEAMLAAAGSLRCVKREVGIADQGVGAGASGVADRRFRPTRRSSPCCPRSYRVARPVRSACARAIRAGRCRRPGQDRLELVAAEASDLPVIAHDRVQPSAT